MSRPHFVFGLHNRQILKTTLRTRWHLSSPDTESLPTASRPLPGKTRLKEANKIWRNSNRVYSNLFATAGPPLLSQAVHIPGGTNEPFAV
jgi:hypothetical protein